MALYPVAVSLIIGFSTGIMYGLFFLLQSKKRVQSFSETTISSSQPLKRYHSSFVLFSALRVLTLFTLWYFLLRSPINHLILVLVSFFTAFWLVIFKDKAKTYDRRACSER